MTKIADNMTVGLPRLLKQESAKVDIYSHCAIPLLHHTHPIPITIKPGDTLSAQDLWSKSEINAVQQSLKRAQKEAIKWLINTSRSEKSGEYGVEYLKWLANLLNLLPFFLRHNVIMALLLIARQPTLILS